MADWTDTELRATVKAYGAMLMAQQSGLPFSKAAYRRQLTSGALKGRSEASIEYRMRNISAVMEEHGLPVVSGYLPAQNVGEAVRAILWKMIQQDTDTRFPESASGGTQLQPKIIYFNIGWMKRYRGMSDDDLTLGAHGFLDDHRHGAESFNFLSTPAGRVEGYRPGETKRLAISRLGAAPGDESVSGVLVIWLAREPVSGRTMVIGWYDNATVYAAARAGSHAAAGGIWEYSVEASAADAHLVPERARTFWVQSARTSPGAGFGQSTTWYGNEAVDRRVWNYVQSVHANMTAAAAKPVLEKPSINTDPELRRKVENAAVDHARRYYESVEGGSCSVESVELYGRGWDLEVTDGTVDWLVEVKGLQGSNLVCELTPNGVRQDDVGELSASLRSLRSQ